VKLIFPQFDAPLSNGLVKPSRATLSDDFRSVRGREAAAFKSASRERHLIRQREWRVIGFAYSNDAPDFFLNGWKRS
jgi:hypothetical protein